VSALEAFANVAIGYLLALATQILAFPLFGIAVTLRQNVLLGLIFLAVSLAGPTSSAGCSRPGS
jgi:hypothetical protein